VPDQLNNVEMVIISAPATGTWTVEVIGTAVTIGNPGQGYALVVCANLTTGSCFVAGAVYGDEAHPDVVFLRDWRDARLDRPAMRLLAAAYDRVGPHLARAVAGRTRLTALLRRRVFVPLVALLRGRSDA